MHGRHPALAAGSAPEAAPALVPIRAQTDRIFDIAVCLRPFRAAGPRLDVERVGDTLVVHNYGHGGSGWSLSWGSGTVAVRKAMASSPREVAVIGCGVLGLTAAILAQRAGAKVTIYARELLPETPSARATGAWTPDSRIALADAAPPDFAGLWEEMARTAFKMHRTYLGLPGDPVEWTDFYSVSSAEEERDSNSAATTPDLDFAEYRRRIADLIPKARRLAPDAAPFRADAVYRSENMIFNISDYGHTLLNDFFIAGGEFRYADFHSPSRDRGPGEERGDQLHGLWRPRAVEGRDGHAGARTDRAADSPAGGALRALLPPCLCRAAARWDRGPGPQGRRHERLRRFRRGDRPRRGGSCRDDPGRAVLAGALARRGAGRSGRKLGSFPRPTLRTAGRHEMPPQLLLPWCDLRCQLSPDETGHNRRNQKP